MSGSTSGTQPVVNVLLGCDPQVNIRITETETGTLFIVVEAADPTMPVGDIDGIFFNLSDSSSLDALNFFPSANEGTIFSPVTSIQAAADAVDTLANGAQVAETYDIGIQFGTVVAGSTQGEVAQANFTLFGDNGPLSIDDLDLDSFATVINSDGDNGQVLTTGDSPDAEPVLVSKDVLFEDFDDIHTATDSAAVESNDGWAVAWDQLVTNASNEGTVTFTEVATEGPVTLTMDLNTHNTHVFENSGYLADSLRVEVQIDGGEWILLDEFQVNDYGTAIVGSETGQSFGVGGNTVTYSGGVLDSATESAQFRVVSDLTNNDEIIKIDNVSVTASELVDGAMGSVTTTLQAENFDNISDPQQSDEIVYDAGWDVSGGELATDGHNDGTLKFARFEAEGDVEITFDARVEDASTFEATGSYADELELQVRLDDGWQTLDTFVVNAEGTALVGSKTGNEITEDGSTLSYSGGVLDDVNGDVQFRLNSDISAGNERAFFDNFEVTQTTQDGTADGSSKVVTVDFDDANSGDVVSGQFEGVTVSAQRAGDDETSQNDAMIFDSNAPTGGDHDLEYADQGNILIISEDNDSSDADDNFNGGTISFDFEEISDVKSLSVLDIEEAGGTIDLFDADGGLLSSINIPAAGNNSATEVTIDQAGVASMDVNLVGSGAVDDLVYERDCEACGQYDVTYVAGVPILAEVEDDQTKVEETEEDVLAGF